ncbi:hypothetical protein X975_20314, partial [Stegodyphus mimosarum]
MVACGIWFPSMPCWRALCARFVNGRVLKYVRWSSSVVFQFFWCSFLRGSCSLWRFCCK